MTTPRTKPKWTVRVCETREDLERLCRFRYEQYVEDRGIFRDKADHDNRLLTDPVDTFAVNFLAEADGVVIGSIRLNRFDQFLQTFVITEYRIMDLSPEVFQKGCAITRAMVHPAWRRTPVFSDLALAAAKRMRDDGLRWIFIDASPPSVPGGEDRFFALYSALGFKIWRSGANIPNVGPVTVMLFDLPETMNEPGTLARAYLAA